MSFWGPYDNITFNRFTHEMKAENTLKVKVVSRRFYLAKVHYIYFCVIVYSIVNFKSRTKVTIGRSVVFL